MNRPFGCKCQHLQHKVAGDGCDECNPEMAKRVRVDNVLETLEALQHVSLKTEASRRIVAETVVSNLQE